MLHHHLVVHVCDLRIIHILVINCKQARMVDVHLHFLVLRSHGHRILSGLIDILVANRIRVRHLAAVVIFTWHSASWNWQREIVQSLNI